MINLLDIEISYFQKKYSLTSSPITIKQVLDLIKNEKFKTEIDSIRNEINKNKKNELKGQLPSVTISGTFNGNRKKENIKYHSGLIQIDIDDIENIEFVKNNLINDPY
jgi:hypothetical protein